MLSTLTPERSRILDWMTKYENEEHEKMLHCKGPCRSWYLQMMSYIHFYNGDLRQLLSNPNWFILQRDPPPSLTENTSDDVFQLLVNAGSMIQEVFGLNYLDLMSMDMATYTKFKKKVLEVYNKRLEEHKAQEDELARQRAEDEARQRREEAERNRK